MKQVKGQRSGIWGLLWPQKYWKLKVKGVRLSRDPRIVSAKNVQVNKCQEYAVCVRYSICFPLFSLLGFSLQWGSVVVLWAWADGRCSGRLSSLRTSVSQLLSWCQIYDMLPCKTKWALLSGQEKLRVCHMSPLPPFTCHDYGYMVVGLARGLNVHRWGLIRHTGVLENKP